MDPTIASHRLQTTESGEDGRRMHEYASRKWRMHCRTGPRPGSWEILLAGRRVNQISASEWWDGEGKSLDSFDLSAGPGTNTKAANKMTAVYPYIDTCNHTYMPPM